MLEEYNNTLKLFKNQKHLLLDKADNQNLSIDDLNNIINQICQIDKKINEYENLIEKETNNNKENDNIHITEKINKNHEQFENTNIKKKSKNYNLESESEKKVIKLLKKVLL